ncbi:uncharacterized protein LOC128864916 [Anastrepha ludens]|uniref:uncharacterized protein LOC128864916 n=1 Tax=Anastrepha ludens TaxID=28586 RepID=UPI0023B08285|nr:uncharacterized protein LOC128864916 [Anastrepha ludens]
MRKHLAIALFCLIVICCQGATLCRLISKFTDPLKEVDSDAPSNLVSVNSIPAAVKQDDINPSPVQKVLKPIPEEINIFHKLICNFAQLFSPFIRMGCAKVDDVVVSTTPAVEPTSATASYSTDDESSTVTYSEAPFGSSSEASATDASEIPIE